mgnify:CR=1 FL=1
MLPQVEGPKLPLGLAMSATSLKTVGNDLDLENNIQILKLKRKESLPRWRNVRIGMLFLCTYNIHLTD